jgi:hypothetical protein
MRRPRPKLGCCTEEEEEEEDEDDIAYLSSLYVSLMLRMILLRNARGVSSRKKCNVTHGYNF